MIGASGWATKAAIAIVVIGGAWALLPDAAPGSMIFTIPSVVWDPFTALLGLNRYVPVTALLAVASFEVATKAGLFVVWLTSWVWGKFT